MTCQFLCFFKTWIDTVTTEKTKRKFHFCNHREKYEIAILIVLPSIFGHVALPNVLCRRPANEPLGHEVCLLALHRDATVHQLVRKPEKKFNEKNFAIDQFFTEFIDDILDCNSSCSISLSNSVAISHSIPGRIKEDGSRSPYEEFSASSIFHLN